MVPAAADAVAAAYGLLAPTKSKRAKVRNPRDLTATLAAAKKRRKASDAAAAKALGADPSARKRGEDQRTGLRNLGATCYMNSLLQTLHNCRTFRRGIYAWRAPAAGAASGLAVLSLHSRAQPRPPTHWRRLCALIWSCCSPVSRSLTGRWIIHTRLVARVVGSFA